MLEYYVKCHVIYNAFRSLQENRLILPVPWPIEKFDIKIEYIYGTAGSVRGHTGSFITTF